MDTSNHSTPKGLLNLLTVLLIGGTILASCASTPGEPVQDHTALAGNSAQDHDHSKNPYWSTTDTTKLNVSKAEWKKIQELFNEEMPSLNVMDFPLINAHQSTVCGTKANGMGVDQLQETWISGS